jgi:DNA repair and recombination RAD54-like protein
MTRRTGKWTPLTGTPMQNDLQEFYAMVDFTNPGILGTPEEFRRKTLFPILRGREPDATDAQKRKMMEIQNDMSTTVNDFILRRVNTLNAEHLPPKLVQVVCCNLTEIQQNMYLASQFQGSQSVGDAADQKYDGR